MFFFIAIRHDASLVSVGLSCVNVYFFGNTVGLFNYPAQNITAFLGMQSASETAHISAEKKAYRMNGTFLDTARAAPAVPRVLYKCALFFIESDQSTGTYITAFPAADAFQLVDLNAQLSLTLLNMISVFPFSKRELTNTFQCSSSRSG